VSGEIMRGVAVPGEEMPAEALVDDSMALERSAA
jgi:hypothetical protein